MKKFLLSLCVLAVASVCVFMTSCKDEDDNTSNYETVFNAIAPLLDPSCTYTYVLAGKTYDNLEDLAAAMAELPTGSTATVTVNATTADGQKKSGSVTGTVPAPGKQSSISYDIPQGGNKADRTGKVNVTWPTTVTPKTHNGGAAGN